MLTQERIYITAVETQSWFQWKYRKLGTFCEQKQLYSNDMSCNRRLGHTQESPDLAVKF